MKNRIFSKVFLIIFAISFAFIGCNEENATSTTNVTKKIVPNGPVNPIVSYPSDRLYNYDHEWIKFDNDTTITMGVTDYAIQLIGTTCSISEDEDIPIERKYDSTDLNPFLQKKRISLITGTQDTMNFYVNFESLLYLKNPLIDSDPTIVSTDPYDSGWIYKLKDFDTTGANFMNSNEYENYVNSL